MNDDITGMTVQERADMNVRVQRAIDRIYSQQLSNILLVMIVYYATITVSHFFFLAADTRTILMFLTSLTGLFSSALYFSLRKHLLRHSQSHIAFVPIGLLSVASVYAHTFLTADMLQLTNGVLLLFAFGFGTLSQRIFGVFFVLNSTLYIGVLFLVPGEHVAHFAFMYLGAGALGLLCFILRYRTTFNAEWLLVANRQKTSQLVAISRQMQQETEQARLAADSAERANKAKDAFLANTTHELRTPLTGVLGMLDLLDSHQLAPQQKEAVVAAKFSASTLLVIVNDLLDLAKIDAGTFALKALPFSLKMVVRHVCDLLRPQAIAKGLMLEVKGLQMRDAPLIGDPVRIGQILLNLLDNAIKFTEQGVVTVTVKMDEPTVSDKVTEGVRSISIAVRDTGVGIGPEDWGRLFERFEQLDNSATRMAEGAGLGLSICQSLAMRMEGRIAADSTLGKGSEFTFSVTLPLAFDLDDVDLSFVSKPGQLIEMQKPFSIGLMPQNERGHMIEESRPHILLAEDNRVNQMLVKKLAGIFNWNLEVVENGEEAVRSVEENAPYDLILMDIRMPVMDGVQATRLIKNMPAFRSGVPIIALTANTGKEDLATYAAVGMQTVVGKPIDMVQLKDVVEAALAQQTD